MACDKTLIYCLYNIFTRCLYNMEYKKKTSIRCLYNIIGMFSLFFRCIQKWMKTDAQTV